MRTALVVALVLTAGAAFPQAQTLPDCQLSLSMCGGEKRALEAIIANEAEDAAQCPLMAAPDASVRCPGWEPRTCRERDAKGKLRRSATIKREFLKRYGYARGRKGYVLDHLFPLACGGCDVPWNIQFQDKADGKAKDKWERDVCADDGDAAAEEDQ